jgi:hypothetical protein
VGDNFLGSIVTGDETWIPYYEPESKQQSKERLHKGSPTNKKFKAENLLEKSCAVFFFWDQKGAIFMDFLE